jgi:hypothetical protein
VDHQLAEQHAERDVGGHELAAVEAEGGRRRPVADDLVEEGGEPHEMATPVNRLGDAKTRRTLCGRPI